MLQLKPKQLIIVARQQQGLLLDAHAIVCELVRAAPHIKVSLATPHDSAADLGIEWDLPTTTIGIGTRLGRLIPRRGSTFENVAVKKQDQYSRMLSAGIATPKTGILRPNQRFLPQEWSEYVILKPLSLKLTSRGNSVKLYRSKALADLEPARLPPDHVLRKEPVIVQDFIDTGLYPSKWRVLSLFGEALYSSFSTSMLPRADFTADDATIEASVVEPRTNANVDADTLDERDRLLADPAVLQFAKSIHRAFDRLPLLGIDILRREADGKLFALEINAGGNVWHFSSYAEKHRERLGGKQAMINQLGAWNVAARTLFRIVEKHAC